MSTPSLIFLRNQPRDWLEQPPLASALQTFETSLINLAMGRYPSALVLTVSALESLIKAYRRIPAPQTLMPDGKKVRDQYLLKLWEELAAEGESKWPGRRGGEKLSHRAPGIPIQRAPLPQRTSRGRPAKHPAPAARSPRRARLEESPPRDSATPSRPARRQSRRWRPP